MREDFLQPSLLERLTFDKVAPGQAPPDGKGINEAALRESVRRDLEWLFKTSRLGELIDFKRYPEARRSVLNFGIQRIGGRSASAINRDMLERDIKRALLDFEPRLRKVRVMANISAEGTSYDAVSFDIQAELIAEPTKLALHLHGSVDLERSDVQLHQIDRGEP